MAIEWSFAEAPREAFEALYADREEAAAQHRIYLARMAAAKNTMR